MDEPFAALDALLRNQMQDDLLAIWQQEQHTILFVTHDIEEAVFLGQKIMIFGPRPTYVREVVENQEMGEVGYREEPLFFERVKKIRGLLVT